ncbi:MAG: lysophospholipid acyltransferase family protein [Pirellulales bacterium]
MTRKFIKQSTDFGAYLALRIVICLIQTFSIETCAAASRCVAILMSDVFRLRGKTVDDNLRLAFPQWTDRERQVVRRHMWEHLILMVCEVAHAPRKIRETNWHKYVKIVGRREIVSYLLDRRPIVLVSGHFGNFEVGCFLIGLLGFSTSTIARTLDNRYLDRWVKKFREKKGQYILDKDGSASQVADLLARGGKVTLLADQFAGPKGCWVDFFGKPTSCHKAVALFTLGSKAPMLVISNARDGRPLHYTVRLEGLADPAQLPDELGSVPGLTRWYNQRLEDAIRRTPDQYWWLHRRWRGDPPTRKGAKATPTNPAESQRPAA